MKTCTACKLDKDESEFHAEKNRAGRLILRARCRTCQRARWDAYEARNRERRNAKASSRRISRPDDQKGANRRFYLKNADAMRERALKWARDNPAKAAASRSRRRAAEKRATPGWVDHVEIQRRYDWAQLLTEEFGTAFHVDHVVPLTSPIVCGLHWHGNLAVIPAPDNQAKSNRRWPHMPEGVQ